MSTPVTKTQRRRSTLVLGTYPGEYGTRRLYARHKDDATYLTDEPVSGRGGVYQVDTIPDSDGAGAVHAIAALYLREALQLGDSPMTVTALDPDLQEADLSPDVLWIAA